MQKQETLIVLGINTIIVVIVLFILFRMQDNKVRSYIKKLERKLLRPQFVPEYDPNMIQNPEQMQLQQLQQLQQIQHTQQMQQMQQTQQNPSNIMNENRNNINSDMDSYIDPMDEK